ncbi:MAG TPA: EAL domain-containing protein [Thauera sp.]|nr:EAL domain-containing protein [Thauera sp.]
MIDHTHPSLNLPAATSVFADGGLDALVDALPALVWVKSPDGVFLHCNRQVEALLGRSRDQILGRTDADFFAEAEAAAFRADDLRALAAMQPVSREEWLTFARDGHRELVLTTKAPLHGADGRLIGVLGIAHDVTHERRMRAALDLLAADSTPRTGVAFHERVCRHLVEALDADYVFVGAVDAVGERVNAVAGWSSAGRMQAFDYALADSPCEHVIGRAPCVYAEGVAMRFPRDEALVRKGIEGYCAVPLIDHAGHPLGLLALLSRRPLAQPQVVLDLLQIFDAPVSAELENSRNLSALRRRVSLEQTLARISARIVGAEHERLDEVIVEALGELAGHARADRAYVFAVAEDDAHACNTHEWCAPGVSTQIGSLQQVRFDHELLFARTLRAFDCVDIEDVEALDDEARLDREILLAQGIHSTLAAPMRSNKRLSGFIGFDSVHARRRWADEEKALLALAGDAIRNALERRDAERRLRQSEARFRQLFEKIPNISVQGYDAQRNVIFWNEASTALYGFSAEEALGRRLDELLIPPEMRADLEVLHRDWIEKGVEIPAGELNLLRKDGSSVPVFSSHVMQRNADGEFEMYCIDIDLAEQRQAQASQRLAASVFSYAREGILITDGQGLIVDANEAYCRQCGYTREEILGHPAGMFQSGRHGAEFYAVMRRSLSERGFWSGEIWNRRKSGEHYPALLTISAVPDAGGEALRYVALYADIAAQKAHEAELEFLAHHDALTGLPNRALLRDRLEQAIAQARRREQRVAVAYLDLDGFKLVNDQHGHALGDRLLKQFAGGMRAALREGDTIARLGGDEFAAVLVDVGEHGAFVPFVMRLLDVVSRPVDIDGVRLQLSASIGVSLFPQPDVVDADQLLRQADQAMYQAKLAGKNRFCIFDTELDRSVRGHHETLAQVAAGLRRGEFELFYQPKVNMRTGAVIGLEALIRWHHPQRGLLSPGAFLADVEASPLAVELGEWVIDTALAQHVSWREQGLDLPVSVNISAEHLQRADFVARLEALLGRQRDIGPGRLEIEVLETSALGNLEHVAEVIRGCRRLGVRFALDDFGTGYASLAYLKHLPADVLKIDQTFVRDMLEDPDDLAILEGVIGLAKAFRRQAVAEGVESIVHARRLLLLGCEFAQGYGIARPMPAAAVPVWVTAWRPDPSWQSAAELGRDQVLLLYAGAELAHWCALAAAALGNQGAEVPAFDIEGSAFGRWLAAERASGAVDAPACEALQDELAQLAQLCERCAGAPAAAGSRPSLIAELGARRAAIESALDAVLRAG